MQEQDHPYLIVGLGNVGRTYQNNRHNVGFMVLNRLAQELDVPFSTSESDALVGRTSYQGHAVILAKPQTSMNNSGKAVRSLLRLHKLPLERLLVAYDDVDLPFESLRLRPEGGAGGQKGLQSIIDALGTESFRRLRIGVGRPPGRMPVDSYVLRDFSKQEREVLSFVLDDAVQAILTCITEGIHQAMNEYNRTPS